MAKIYKCRKCHKDLEYCHAKNCWKYQCNCDTDWVSVDSDAKIKLAVYAVKHLIKSEDYHEHATWWKD